MFRITRLPAVLLIVAAAPIGLADEPSISAGSVTDTTDSKTATAWTDELESTIRESIRTTVRPTSRAFTKLSSEAHALLRWSQPVNGLIARVEGICEQPYGEVTTFVRMKNVSKEPITVSVSNRLDLSKPSAFELHVQRYGGKWHRAAWLKGEVIKDGDKPGQVGSFERYLDRDRHEDGIRLRPGESCVARLPGRDSLDRGFSELALASRIKVVLRQRESKDSGVWRGVLETPDYPRYPSEKLLAELNGRLPFPEYFPDLADDFYGESYIDDIEDPVRQLRAANGDIIQLVALYEPAAVAAELERRLSAARGGNRQLQLLLASLAAGHGSENAALFLLDSAHSGKGLPSSALSMVLFHSEEGEPPAWIVKLIEATIRTDHYDHSLLYHLGQRRCASSIPLLLEIAQRDGGRSYACSSLRMLECREAIPILLSAMRKGQETANLDDEWSSQELVSPLIDLLYLKSHEALPTAVGHLEFVDLVEALEICENAEAIPALEKLISDNGRVVRGGKELFADKAPERLRAARLAVLTLRKQDVLPTVSEMLRDVDLQWYHRRDLIWRLRRLRDPRSVQVLVDIASTDASARLVNEAINALGDIACRESVLGLLATLDDDFTNKDSEYGENDPSDFLRHIAAALRKITQQSLGPDTNQWQAWWDAEGKGLKF